jgi:hypothetical protein
MMHQGAGPAARLHQPGGRWAHDQTCPMPASDSAQSRITRFILTQKSEQAQMLYPASAAFPHDCCSSSPTPGYLLGFAWLRMGATITMLNFLIVLNFQSLLK